MKKVTLKSLILVSTVFGLLACGGTDIPDNPPEGLPANVQAAIDGPLSKLNEDLKDSITYMYNEEGLAYYVYTNIYKIQPAQQLQSIAENAETNHMQAVDELAIKYDLNMTTYDPTLEPYSKEGIGGDKYTVQHIQDLYELLYAKGEKSMKDALEVGCMVEVVDIDDLNGYIIEATTSNASDVLTVFNYLRNGSYNHYWTFNDALKKLNDPTGLDELAGCCSVEEKLDGFNWCHIDDYPPQ